MSIPASWPAQLHARVEIQNLANCIFEGEPSADKASWWAAKFTLEKLRRRDMDKIEIIESCIAALLSELNVYKASGPDEFLNLQFKNVFLFFKDTLELLLTTGRSPRHVVVLSFSHTFLVKVTTHFNRNKVLHDLMRTSITTDLQIHGSKLRGQNSYWCYSCVPKITILGPIL